MAQVQVRALGLNTQQKKLNRMAKSVANRRAMFTQIGIKVINEISNTFKGESHEGKPWKPLSPVTIAMRRSGGISGTIKILQDTGKLRREFVSKPTNNDVKIGTPTEYAPKHEFGENIPRRQMLPSRERGLKIATKEVTVKVLRDKVTAGL